MNGGAGLSWSGLSWSGLGWSGWAMIDGSAGWQAGGAGVRWVDDAIDGLIGGRPSLCVRA